MLRTLLIFALLVISYPTAAQHLVRGRVTDGENPVGYATVVLLREGQQVAGATTGNDGRFEVEAEKGSYTLVLRHVAYQSFERTVDLSVSDTDTGELRLEHAAIREVTVTAETVTREADRFVVNIGDSPALAGRDGVELLARAPGVWVSDSGISINGASGTKVYIDGRELKGTAEEITSYLRSLTAADVARIEVVPLAGTEYAADTRGGVLLITLRRKRSDGIDGNVQASTIQGEHLANYAPSGRIGIRAGRWTLNASGSGILTPRAETFFTETRKYSEPSTSFAGTSDGRSRSNYGRGNIAAIFDPNPRHTVGLEIEYTGRSTRMPSVAHTTVGETASDSRYAQHRTNSTLTATANYIWKIDTLGSQLKLIADYTRYSADGDNLYNTTTSMPGLSRDSLYRSATASTYDILTADLALIRKFSRGLTLRTGVRYTRNGMDDKSRYDALQQGAWQPLPDYGYAQQYTEQTAAAHASLAYKTGRWDLSAGLRGEYTSVASSILDRSYFSLFPNASVSYALSDLRTWMLVAQWGRNIERPSFPALNPTRYQLSEYSWQSGNPSLRPTYIHRLSFTVVWRYRYTLTVGGNLHHDLIREVAHTDQTDPDVIYIRPENHHTENHWFVAASLPIKITKWWNFSVNAVGVMQRIRLERTDAPSNHYLLFTDATAGFTLPAGFYIEAVYRGQSRLYSGNSEVGPRHTLSATVKKQFFDKRLTLFVTGSNLNGCREEYVSTTDNIRRVIRGHSAWSSRQWKIGASWNFRSGRQFSSRTVESAAAGERKRLTKEDGQSK